VAFTTHKKAYSGGRLILRQPGPRDRSLVIDHFSGVGLLMQRACPSPRSDRL